MAGVEGSHWSKEERAELQKQGFDADGTYSIIGKFIRSLGATFLDNSFNPRFLPNPEKGIELETSTLVNKVYIAEKNKRRYRKSKLDALQNGLIYRGVEEIPDDSGGETDTSGPTCSDGRVADQERSVARRSRHTVCSPTAQRRFGTTFAVCKRKKSWRKECRTRLP